MILVWFESKDGTSGQMVNARHRFFPRAGHAVSSRDSQAVSRGSQVASVRHAADAVDSVRWGLVT